MGNNQANEKPADKQQDEALNKEHINKQGKKENTSDIYLEPEEGGTLQTPEEFAKDKGKISGDEEEK
ncbi:hypothetical protein [Chitinophaga filiformis]|uniref:Uncharacterized protein n=1 Tax=Chitinophaga filiformis TaxID=104663 RepID=A0A1G7YGC6_CHIFI|nr:hypothetical protein [Chitinophaga filiformis]SDG95571.1 hypothetical protein SAMN04488121_107341 [Chitinophaga filiformis]